MVLLTLVWTGVRLPSPPHIKDTVMKLTTKQKTWLSALSIAIAAAMLFVAFEYTPKIGGKIFLGIFAFIMVKWVNDFIKHEKNN